MPDHWDGNLTWSSAPHVQPDGTAPGEDAAPSGLGLALGAGDEPRPEQHHVVAVHGHLLSRNTQFWTSLAWSFPRLAHQKS
jgi:hypothetical protein